MIQPMSKLRLVGPRAILPNVLDTTYRYGKMHIDKVTYPTLDMQTTTKSFALKEMSLSDDDLKELAELEGLLARTDELIKSLSQIPEVQRELASLPAKDVDASGAFAQKGVDQLQAVLNKIEEEKEKLYSQKSRMEEESGQLLGFGKLIETFASLMEKTHDIASLEVVGFTVDKNKKGAIDLLKERLHHEITDDYEIFTASMDRRTMACIIAASRKNMLKVKQLFTTEGIQELSLPDEFADKSLREIRILMQEKKADMPKVKTDVEAQIKELALKNISRLNKLKRQLQDRIAYFGEVPKFAETKFTFLMQGWLPSENLPKFRELMNEAYKSSVMIDEQPITEAEKKDIPVTLRNPALIQPFEMIMKLFKPPAYGTIDPTWFLAIFFPIIFGMILGDIFYGLLILPPALWLWKKKTFSRILRNVGYILTVCGISTIIFGFFYGEFLGDMGHALHLTPVINREHGIIPPLALAVGFGVFHIVFSLLLRGVGAYREHHKFNAHVVESMSTILVILALVGALVIALGLLPQGLMTPTLVLLLVAFVMVVVSAGIAGGFAGGIVGGLEIFGTLGNIMSYARIMAIGLSSVILAMVANKIARGAPSLAFGVLIAIMLHMINLVLGVFGPTVHGLRLHFVESFQKFVKFEGRTYQPFKRGGE